MARPAHAIQVIQSRDEARALMKRGRRRILEELAEPDSAAGLARQLNLPRQKINYHLRELEKQGLVELVEERRKGNCVERIVRATAKTYLISPSVLGQLGEHSADVRDKFSISTLISNAARTIRDLTILRSRADRAGKKLATLSLETEVKFASAADRNAFAEELATQLAELAARYHTEKAPGGRLFRFSVGGYPVITKKEDDTLTAVRLE